MIRTINAQHNRLFGQIWPVFSYPTEGLFVNSTLKQDTRFYTNGGDE